MKKRIFTLFLLLAVVVGLFPAAMAAGTEQITVRFYNEVSQRYSEPTVTDRVNLTLDGEALIPEDVPALAYYPEGSTNGRTLVPVRLISEALDATVTWVPETRQIIILREESTIVLTAGSATALVDGQAVELPDGVPAGGVMWDGKESTMVPLRFVSEQLGAGVEWVGETATVAITSPEEPQQPDPTQPQEGDLGLITELSFDEE